MKFVLTAVSILLQFLSLTEVVSDPFDISLDRQALEELGYTDSEFDDVHYIGQVEQEVFDHDNLLSSPEELKNGREALRKIQRIRAKTETEKWIRDLIGLPEDSDLDWSVEVVLSEETGDLEYLISLNPKSLLRTEEFTEQGKGFYGIIDDEEMEDYYYLDLQDMLDFEELESKLMSSDKNDEQNEDEKIKNKKSENENSKGFYENESSNKIRSLFENQLKISDANQIDLLSFGDTTKYKNEKEEERVYGPLPQFGPEYYHDFLRSPEDSHETVANDNNKKEDSILSLESVGLVSRHSEKVDSPKPSSSPSCPIMVDRLFLSWRKRRSDYIMKLDGDFTRTLNIEGTSELPIWRYHSDLPAMIPEDRRADLEFDNLVFEFVKEVLFNTSDDDKKKTESIPPHSTEHGDGKLVVPDDQLDVLLSSLESWLISRCVEWLKSIQNISFMSQDKDKEDSSIDSLTSKLENEKIDSRENHVEINRFVPLLTKKQSAVFEEQKKDCEEK